MKDFLLGEYKWVKSFVSEKDGKASTKSVTLLTMLFVFCFNYNRIAWKKEDLLDIPEMWAVFLAVGIGLKIWDSKVQAKALNGNSNPPPTQ